MYDGFFKIFPEREFYSAARLTCFNHWESYYPNAVIHIPKETSIVVEFPFIVGFYDARLKYPLAAFLYREEAQSPWFFFKFTKNIKNHCNKSELTRFAVFWNDLLRNEVPCELDRLDRSYLCRYSLLGVCESVIRSSETLNGWAFAPRRFVPWVASILLSVEVSPVCLD